MITKNIVRRGVEVRSRLAQDAGIGQREARLFKNVLVEVISSYLERGEEVNIDGLGKFSLQFWPGRERPTKTLTNLYGSVNVIPLTVSEDTIRIKFKPCGILKERVKQGFYARNNQVHAPKAARSPANVPGGTRSKIRQEPPAVGTAEADPGIQRKNSSGDSDGTPYGPDPSGG